MRTIPDWDHYYLEICKVVAQRSKDPNTQIGCVIVGPAHEIRSTGYNSFPRGIRDDLTERLERPAKYLWIEHAERNAIFAAARAGLATAGATLIATFHPCADCARAIVQAGIANLHTLAPDFADPLWGPAFRCSRAILEEGGVRVIYLERDPGLMHASTLGSRPAS